MPNLNERQFQEPQLFDTFPYEHIKDPYQEGARERAIGGNVVVQAPLEAVEGIAKEGELLSQHYTGTSRGALTPERRAEWEEYQGLETPVYGTLQTPADPPPPAQYGHVEFTLGRHTRPRTTAIYGDSLGHEGRVARLDEVAEGGARLPQSRSLEYASRGGEQAREQVQTLDPDRHEWAYVETQVEPRPHERGVPLSDVRQANFKTQRRVPEDDQYPDIVDQRLYETGQEVEQARRLEEAGVKTYMDRKEQSVQMPLSRYFGDPQREWHQKRYTPDQLDKRLREERKGIGRRA